MLIQLVESPRKFPVEFALGLTFCVLAIWHSEASGLVDGVRYEPFDGNVLAFFPPLMALTYFLHSALGRNNMVYWLSYVVFVPLLLVDLKHFLFTPAFFFTYVLAALLLLAGHRSLSNGSFARRVVGVTVNFAVGMVLSVLLFGAVMAIIQSVNYIFSAGFSDKVFHHAACIVWFVVAPMFCCFFLDRTGQEAAAEPAKPLKMLLNFILSPAVIVYTFILYAYAARILLAWELPKGGVAWMVMGFMAVALTGLLLQHLLERHHYNFYYKHFAWIAVAPLLLYWVGALERVGRYGFTESRVYLILAGVVMTLFVAMLCRQRTRRFWWMAVIAGMTIVAFTYFPGITAKDIGLRSQTERFQALSDGLLDSGGKLRTELDLAAIRSDSALSERYAEAASALDYIRDVMGSKAFGQRYGTWNYSERDFRTNTFPAYKDVCPATEALSVGDYTQVVVSDDYVVTSQGAVLTVNRIEDGQLAGLLLKVDLQQRLDAGEPLDSLFVCRNDSLMVILKEITVDPVSPAGKTRITSIADYNATLLRKP